MIVVAIVAAAAGGLANLGAVLLVTGGGGGTDVAPLVAGGGTAVMATALGYVVRQLLSGNLVARSTAEIEKRLSDLVDKGEKREERMLRLLEGRKS